MADHNGEEAPMPDPTLPARCWCGDTVTIADDGYMCCGTDMFHDPDLPPLLPPAEAVRDA